MSGLCQWNLTFYKHKYFMIVYQLIRIYKYVTTYLAYLKYVNIYFATV